MAEPYRSVTERCEILPVELHDRGETESARLPWEADARIRELQEEARSWRAVAERLETEMQELLRACDCEIRDQTNNRTASDKRSAAYAEGALRVAEGIAHRIREKAPAR
ncbi:hypothetical protein [Methylobacterium pseudosasicola]|uniref:Uncharacterized protein n=1 Tax=Methylobacterium pseudosasicola TaxID=582667 RepID=A0A1I4U0D4_9HYPH|nr:hypothetical protein [Methylobacterium pseudosasicola]SFM82319.1 hypothetical protein SAMN05192568_106110 [Methylobacterium pseudosasicola]